MSAEGRRWAPPRPGCAPEIHTPLLRAGRDAEPGAAAAGLDLAVRLVVATADEGRVRERSEMSIDEGPRPVVVDREEDDVSLAGDRSDIGLVEELGGGPAG